MRTGIAKAAVGHKTPGTAQDAIEKICPGSVQPADEQIRTDLGHKTGVVTKREALNSLTLSEYF